jgi:predicted MFS family arabinose efflux permease
LISLGAGVVCVSPPLVASVTSRIDRRTLLSAILLWLALGHIASVFAPNYASLLAIRLAMLAFAGAFTPLAAGTAALLVSENKRASAIASVLLGWALAIAIGLPLVSVTAPQIGWQATYTLLGILAALGFLALLLGLPKQLKGLAISARLGWFRHGVRSGPPPFSWFALSWAQRFGRLARGYIRWRLARPSGVSGLPPRPPCSRSG